MHHVLFHNETIHSFYEIFLHEKSNPEELLFFIDGNTIF